MTTANGDDLLRLFPQPAVELPLEGAYLAHDLRRFAVEMDRPFVYSNFVLSVDGRIAVPREEGPGVEVPKQIANERDWRLFQELAAQADLIISSGRYLREWAEGRAQEILQVDDPRFADLREWRLARGLKPQADIAIVSRSMRFPVPEVLTAGGREVVVFTDERADRERLAAVKEEVGQVFIAGQDGVDGRSMVEIMGELGYRTIYSAAGPRINHMLLAGGVLNRIYVTHAGRILGGPTPVTMVEGTLFSPPVDVKLNAIYWDAAALDGLGQLLVSYDL